MDILTTGRLILKPMSLDYVADYRKFFVNYNVIEYLSAHVPWPFPDDGIEAFLNRVLPSMGSEEWLWGLFLKSNPDEMIGGIHLWKKSRPENRGFWLGEPFWGKGLMTEAAYAVNDYAFHKLGFEKLIFANALGNTKSRRVKEKTGSIFLRTEQAKFVNPNYTEHEIWELTKENWLKFRNS